MVSARTFEFASKAVGVLPESVGRTAFELVGAVAGWMPISGVSQLRKNQARIAPAGSWLAVRRRSSQAMRSYMRYYYEAFRLPTLTKEQIRARVVLHGDDKLRQWLASGNSCTGALLHMGNWDLAGAWSTLDLAPVTTIAEKLNPEELADFFLSFRRSLGMTIFHAIKGSHATAKITERLREPGQFSPLLCDRDLSAQGLEVQLCGHAIRVAPGAAIIAQNLNIPMFPVTVVSQNFRKDRQRVRSAGSPWGIQIYIGEPLIPRLGPQADLDQRKGDQQRMCQEWITGITPILKRHLTDWHMLQKVFVADLDPDRLARAVARENAREKDEEGAGEKAAVATGEKSDGNPRGKTEENTRRKAGEEETA